MAPKRAQLQPESIPELSSDSEDSDDEDCVNPESYSIRVQYDEYKKALRIAKDLKKQRDSPVLMNFAKAAWQEGFSRSVDSIYTMYKRAIKNNAEGAATSVYISAGNYRTCCKTEFRFFQVIQTSK